jgi:hypothetical protein
MHQHVIWTLTPTLARQAFSTAAMAWVEAPWYSSHIWLVPHLMQRDFGRVNKNILLVGHFWQLPLPADVQPLVPFLIFYLPLFIRSIPKPNAYVGHGTMLDVSEGGGPFTSSLFTNIRGLDYPSQLTSFPFICEGCTVRVFLKRELFTCLKDIHLLKLECTRMIDMAHAWSHGTYSGLN